MKNASYRKYNDRSCNSSTYHKKDGTNIRQKLKKEIEMEDKAEWFRDDGPNNQKPKEVMNVLHDIGQFFLQENCGDYHKTEDDIRKLRILDVTVDGDVVYIYLCRVGLLIGRKGERITKLTEFLGKKIHMIEDNDINDMIVPWDDSQYFSDQY